MRVFLNFTTASDRPPLRGHACIDVQMPPGLSLDSLPTGHTCFSQLRLPHYASYDVFRAKLEEALDYFHHDKGFRLM